MLFTNGEMGNKQHSDKKRKIIIKEVHCIYITYLSEHLSMRLQIIRVPQAH